MEVDPLELAGKGPDEDDAVPRKRSRLNPAVAVTVALIATFMGICKVKDDNIVQAMQQAQADKIDHWAFYQARNLREELADLSDALLAIAISLLAISSLTQLWWLYLLSLVPAGFGVLMGLSGLAGWSIHPSALIRLLS